MSARAEVATGLVKTTETGIATPTVAPFCGVMVSSSMGGPLGFDGVGLALAGAFTTAFPSAAGTEAVEAEESPPHALTPASSAPATTAIPMLLPSRPIRVLRSYDFIWYLLIGTSAPSRWFPGARKATSKLSDLARVTRRHTHGHSVTPGRPRPRRPGPPWPGVPFTRTRHAAIPQPYTSSQVPPPGSAHDGSRLLARARETGEVRADVDAV